MTSGHAVSGASVLPPPRAGRRGEGEDTSEDSPVPAAATLESTGGMQSAAAGLPLQSGHRKAPIPS